MIVAGDSDYIALAQRCKRLGRYVIGIGVAGGTSSALIAACDEFELYDAIPGVVEVVGATKADAAVAPRGRGRGSAKAPRPPTPGRAVNPDAAKSLGALSDALFVEPEAADNSDSKISDAEATRLLIRALEFGHSKDDAEWLNPPREVTDQAPESIVQREGARFLLLLRIRTSRGTT